MKLASIKAMIAAALLLATPSAKSFAAPAALNIVAIGASNTLGWGVSANEAYPARLEKMLRFMS